MFINGIKNKHGFSFIEIMIYVSFLAGLIIVLASAFTEFLAIIEQHENFYRVEDNAQLAMNKIVYFIKHSESVLTEKSSLDTSQGRLVLKPYESNDPIVIEQQGDGVFIRWGQGEPIALLSQEVAARHLIFKLFNNKSSGMVQISLAVSSVADANISQTAQTSAALEHL
ncbi:MAG: hypothetical protein HY602_02730 [Parcubacteria group bacterium]|nr:hypothetical protein [Parcubacteria group bacterium]